MAIFRGIGGAGDSTTDATITAVTQKAAEAAASATAAESSATSASNSASSASNSATNAASSATTASTSATNASNSATTASTAATAASSAQTAAETAQAAAETAETNAETAETNAATSATNAATSATNAATSETNAATSATAASTSATASASSATDAQTAQSAAETAKTNAETAEANAATSATAAASSATAASTSASNASTSETNASTSASAASTSATNAATSATASASSATSASNSATAALTSETNAATSESNAATSATSASNSATASANSASAAATSASNASTSATAAQTAQTNAETAETNAEAALDEFTDLYLGVKSSAPTLDNDGDALQTGALYYNSTEEQLYVWDGSVWNQAAFSVSGAVTSFNTRTGSVTLGSSDVTTALGYTPATAAQGTLADSAIQPGDNISGLTNDSGYVTQSAINTSIANLVDSAPVTLDTLNELAAALGDDANFSTTVTNSLATKAPLASPALTGTPTAPTATANTNTTQLATTAYVQGELANEANWNTAYGWGDHSAVGYLTDYTVTEGDVTAHQAALSITESQISDLQSYAVTTNNLSDLSSASTARTNLGLGSLATLNAVNSDTITDNSVGAAELNVSGNGTSGQALTSDGDGSFSWADAGGGFSTGTLMLFQQTAAPTGWTKQTTHNDKALRVVSGTASSGGTTAMSTALGTPSVSASLTGEPSVGNLSVSVSGNIANTTLTTNTMPSHRHSISSWGGFNMPRSGGGNTVSNGSYYTANAGGSGGHSHSHNLSGSMSGAPGVGNLAISSATAAINVQYVDLIIASKD